MNSKSYISYAYELSDIKERKRGLHSDVYRKMLENSCDTNRNEETALPQITLLPVFSTTNSQVEDDYRYSYK